MVKYCQMATPGRKGLNYFLHKCCFYLKKLIIQLYIYKTDQVKLLLYERVWVGVDVIYLFIKTAPHPQISLQLKLFTSTFCAPETCTAPKNRGGGGAEDDKNFNVVAVAAPA